MSSETKHDEDHQDLLFLYVLQALPLSDIPLALVQISACGECQQEIETLRLIIRAFAARPTDVVPPSASLWDRLARRIAVETGEEPVVPPPQRRVEPEWEQAAPGISVKLLATDPQKDRVSMLVRLAPGGAYPPHRHADVEELYLLEGELMIDEKKPYPGDYNRAEAGSVDQHVWSETGCTCVLLTSTRDVIR
jgi:quercetin dioxygenase-like cupin family protein